jgi:type I restriction-modification system DNA methylase subunit
MARAPKTKNGTAANVGYEAELWRMADALRGSMDAAEYKHVVLGLIFLKYISDAFEAQEDDGEPFAEKMQRLVAQLHKQQAEARRLEGVIARNLKELGYDA